MKAIILAGGKGTRLNAEVPKCLVEVAGKPCIDWVFENLLDSGITAIYPYWDHNKKGTAGVLKELAVSLEDPFIVCNGDTITNVDIKDMLQEHIKAKLEATIYSPNGLDIKHNGGTFIFNKSVLDYIPDTFTDIPDLLDKINSIQLYNPNDTYYFDIGTPQKLAKARRELA